MLNIFILTDRDDYNLTIKHFCVVGVPVLTSQNWFNEARGLFKCSVKFSR